ncbi:DUF3311 domain-containing protein [Sphingomonas bacterium]|uniref:DUF3311 domain-containing protein n=1 Tax=Sphingomonas bacterium TaxID=1895847 RepID=UPI00157577A2|nr:DUF3311 domain-containing protein [Sphingomonas bacterium]
MTGRRARAPRLYRFALLLPFAWQLGGAGAANRIMWRPFGLPFQMAWQMAGVLVASAAIAFVFRRDEAAASTDGERDA